MTPSQWCTRVNAKGLTYSKGKYSAGTFAHSDIALEFASWISAEVKLYIIRIRLYNSLNVYVYIY